MQTVNDIRQTFLDFFAANDHQVVASSPLVPLNDPTLMFTNAGMVQFKNVFTGAETRKYKRAVSSQKCVRAGGKHNDLENVGYTTRHHTFFEMLGNFSFGDYFKEQAIELAWKLVTKEYGLPPEKLLATVYNEDDEAFDLWKKIAGLPESRILRISTSDNFWAMGATGPCGPCSEIFYDHGDHIPGGPPGSPGQDGDRFIEIWNLVFMQYEQESENLRHNLPNPSIDTGMGLERTAAIMQGTHDNYETDLFKALISASAEATATNAKGEHKGSHRVIADHLRSTSFIIADGVLPSNEGRGYVLRRIMRRAMRHARLIGCKEPLMYRLVPELISQMGKAFPELLRAEALITETLKLEESRFRQTLDRGLKLLDEATMNLAKGDELSGDTAFKLYDTYGFPLDLTQDALRAKGMSVDVDAFNIAMERQRCDARKAWAGSGDAATGEVWFAIREKLGASEFLGYKTEHAEGQIMALVVDGKQLNEAAKDDKISVVVNQTPFYAESGGQSGDRGIIKGPGEALINVSDTLKKLGDLHVHTGVISDGTIKVGDDVILEVDSKRRTAIRANHSATHLLHAALRHKLGGHVSQKGSMVSADRLRFDVSHPKAVSDDEIAWVEDEVNKHIRCNAKVATHLMTPDEAIKTGAMALFGEKYGDEVRVVCMGDFSTELCGGTHVSRTGDIGLFKIIAESAVAAGVRRIEALSGTAALKHLNFQDAELKKVAASLKTSPAQITERITILLDERKTMQRDLADARRKLATGGGGGDGNKSEASSDIKNINGVKFIPRLFADIPAKDLKSMADDIKKQITSGVVALLSTDGGKASLVVAVTDDIASRISAVDLVRLGSAVVGGKGGGGRPDMAQAGGPDAGKATDALAAIEDALQQTTK